MRAVRSFERIGSVPSRRQVTYTMLVGRQKNVGNERRPESVPALDHIRTTAIEGIPVMAGPTRYPGKDRRLFLKCLAPRWR
jgi:hypothetical protein